MSAVVCGFGRVGVTHFLHVGAVMYLAETFHGVLGVLCEGDVERCQVTAAGLGCRILLSACIGVLSYGLIMGHGSTPRGGCLWCGVVGLPYATPCRYMCRIMARCGSGVGDGGIPCCVCAASLAHVSLSFSLPGCVSWFELLVSVYPKQMAGIAVPGRVCWL